MNSQRNQSASKIKQYQGFLKTSRTSNTQLRRATSSRKSSSYSKTSEKFATVEKLNSITNAKLQFKKLKDKTQPINKLQQIYQLQSKKDNKHQNNQIILTSKNIQKQIKDLQGVKLKNKIQNEKLTDKNNLQQKNLNEPNLISTKQTENGKQQLNYFLNLSKKQTIMQQLLPQNFFKNLIPISQIWQSNQSHDQITYFKDKEIKIIHKSSQKGEQNKKQNTSLWLGQVFNKCTSSAFKHFVNQDLDYNETKTYCCQQIISNLLEQIRKRKLTKQRQHHFTRAQSIVSFQEEIRKVQRKKIIYQTELMRFINQESSRILSFLCNKYPQTNIQGANKKVSEIVDKMNIDNWASDQFDLIRLSNVKFEYKQNGDYSKQIMQFLNFLTQLPTKKHKKFPNLTNYKFFVLFMNKIFSVIYFKNTNDISKILNANGQLQLTINQNTNITKEQYEYYQKVKKYTNIQIGCKISQNAKQYSKQDIQSGIIKVENNAISRVIDKWAQQLSSKFHKAQKQILHRIYRFKSSDNNSFNKFNEQTRSTLYNTLCEKAKDLSTFTSELKQSMFDLSQKLATNQNSDVSSLQFIKEKQRIVGQFAVKMSQSSSQYFIQILQKQISLLLESIEILKKRWVEKYKYKQSLLYETLNVSLITFKIGDLFRCKIISNQQEICRVLNIINALSQNWENQIIKIIRVKNRLQTGTRDILINFMLDDICPCQIQLAVAQKVSEKQTKFDKFNHFLYELKRAYLGPIMEMCKIWTQYQSKSQTFAKQIQKTASKKIQRKQISEQFRNVNIKDRLNIIQYYYPFICSSCNVFFPRNNIVYFSTLQYGKIICGYCWRVKVTIQQQNIQQMRRYFIFRKYTQRYVNFYKFLNKITQFTNIQEIATKKYQIYIPVKSRLIHMKFLMILKLKNSQNEAKEYEQFALVQTIINQQSKIVKQTCISKINRLQKGNLINSTINSVKQISDIHNQDYFFFAWDLPTKMIYLPLSLEGYCFQLIQKLLPRIRKIQQQQGEKSVKVCAVEIQKDYFYLLPIFVMDEEELTQKVILERNMDYILKSLNKKEEVLQIQNKNITTQWIDLEPSIKLKMAYVIKQIYLNNNNLKKVNFIENLHMLKIFQANNNQIQQIPFICEGLEELSLNSNKISYINKFVRNEDSMSNYKLKLINFAVNPIKKIENIQKLTNLTAVIFIKCQIVKIEGIPQGTVALGLGYNKISKIQNLEKLKNLARLNLIDNNITKIENLQKCQNIQILGLRGNKILVIQNLEKLSNLKVLSLSQTGISSKADCFTKCNYYKGLKSLKKLRKLIIQSNQIQCLFQIIGIGQQEYQNNKLGLSEYSFLQMKQISMADNEIDSIQNIQLIMPYLIQINFEKNKIIQINNITNLTMLKQVNISHNLIQKLPQKDWEKLFHLRSVNFSHNKIKKIPDFSHLSLIKYINFQFNQITQIVKFPFCPIGEPDFVREINLNSNYIFAQQAPQQHFEVTLNAMRTLTKQISVNMLQNGTCVKKLNKVTALKEQLNLQKTIIPQIFTLNDFIT